MKSTYIIIIILALAIVGCDNDHAGIGRADYGGGKTMWDSEGKAYLVEYHVGTTYKLRRVKSSDKVVVTEEIEE